MIVALNMRHFRLVGLVVHELMSDVTESMLEGWVFGERESECKALGYVPCIK